MLPSAVNMAKKDSKRIGAKTTGICDKIILSGNSSVIELTPFATTP